MHTGTLRYIEDYNLFGNIVVSRVARFYWVKTIGVVWYQGSWESRGVSPEFIDRIYQIKYVILLGFVAYQVRALCVHIFVGYVLLLFYKYTV